MARLSGRVALVTGASGGIGGAVCAALEREGAGLATVSHGFAGPYTHPRAESEGLLPIHADLTEAGAADRAVALTLERYGRLDILVNVAGISGRRLGDGPVHEATDEGWDAVMDTNAKTTFAVCRAALRPMLEAGGGTIVNMASVLAYAPGAEHFATHAYAASKGAIIALTKAMAAYYAPRGVRVNAVAPGLIATPMSRRAQEDPAVLEYVRTRQPLTGRLGTSEDVAEAILYLASDEARFLTGVVLEVAGGWSVAG